MREILVILVAACVFTGLIIASAILPYLEGCLYFSITAGVLWLLLFVQVEIVRRSKKI